jgi:Arm DNA-binding domain
MLALGAFPIVTLSDARIRRDDARKLLASGIDPSQRRKAEKAAATVAAQNTFGALAAEYLDTLAERGTAPTTMAKDRWMLHRLAGALLF